MPFRIPGGAAGPGRMSGNDPPGPKTDPSASAHPLLRSRSMTLAGNPDESRSKRVTAKRGPEGGGRGRPPGMLEALARALQRPADRVAVLDDAEGERLAARFEERWRDASSRNDPERALATSTPDRLVIESLFGWLAARLPQGRELLLMLRMDDRSLAARAAAQEALVAAPELVREIGDGVHLMFPDGEFGLALEMVADAVQGAGGRIYKVFVWGAPR